MGDQFLVNNSRWGSEGAVSSPECSGQYFVEGMNAKPPNIFFFCIKHTETVIVRVNTG